MKITFDLKLKRFRKKFAFAAIVASLVLHACGGYYPATPDEPDDEKFPVTLTIEPFVQNPETKVTYNNGNIQWSTTDNVGIFPSSGSQFKLALSDGAGSSSAILNGAGMGFKSYGTYYSYYPYIADNSLSKRKIPVSLTGQVQNGNSNLEHFPKFDYMYTPWAKVNKGSLLFSYKHLVCIIKVDATLPAGSYKQITITAPTPVFVKTGYFDIWAAQPAIIATESSKELTISFKEAIAVNGTTPIEAFLICNPVNLKDVELIVSVIDNNEKHFDCKKTPSCNYLRANSYSLTCNNWTEAMQSDTIAIEDWVEGSDISGVVE